MTDPIYHNKHSLHFSYQEYGTENWPSRMVFLFNILPNFTSNIKQCQTHTRYHQDKHFDKLSRVLE